MIHILLAEDEIALAKIIKDSLESRHEFRITLASHGNEALKLYQKQKPDILVLDVMMPQMDGFTLTKMIRQIDTRTPILFLTARSSVDDLVTGFHLGGNDYLKKPFDMEELIVRILALLNRPITMEEEKQPEIKQTETGYVVDWTKLYPILVTYQQEMDCAPYEAQFAAMIREVQKTYGYSAEDAMLALKDIFAKTYFKEFQP